MTICLNGAALPDGAVNTGASCWQYVYKFACENSTPVDTCSAYKANPSCGVVASQCVDTDPVSGKCLQYDYTYRCKTGDATQEKRLECSSGLFDSTSMTAPVVKNKNFGKAAVAQEILRQAQVYNDKGASIFSGVEESCSKGWGGLRNCCKSSPGAKNNAQVQTMAFETGLSAAKYAGGNAIDSASTYVFDAMYKNDLWSSGMTARFLQNDWQTLSTNFGSSGFSLPYGFTAGFGSAPQGAGLLLTPNTAEFFVSFNPYAFAASVAVQVITELMSCNQSEQTLAMHRGAKLTHYVKTECSEKIPLIGCVEWKQYYCSYNSVLARLVNIQGKAQLGKSVEGCSGFTVEEIGKLDFDKFNLSEFVNEMTQKAVSNLPKDIKGNYTPMMQSTSQGSSQGKSYQLPSYLNQ